MKRARAIGWCVMIAGVAAGWFIFPGNRQPVYQHQLIGYWFDQLPVTLVSSNFVMTGAFVTSLGQQYGDTNLTSDTFAAFDHFGPRAIPYLFEKLKGEDSYAETKAIGVAWKLGARKVPFRNAQIERAQAVTALLRMDLPQDSLEALARLRTNQQPDIAASASYILRQRQGAARSAVP